MYNIVSKLSHSYKFMGVNFMSENNSKKMSNYYFPLSIGIGILFGVVLNQIPIGLCLGTTIGLTLDYKNKK